MSGADGGCSEGTTAAGAAALAQSFAFDHAPEHGGRAPGPDASKSFGFAPPEATLPNWRTWRFSRSPIPSMRGIAPTAAMSDGRGGAMAALPSAPVLLAKMAPAESGAGHRRRLSPLIEQGRLCGAEGRGRRRFGPGPRPMYASTARTCYSPSQRRSPCWSSAPWWRPPWLDLEAAVAGMAACGAKLGFHQQHGAALSHHARDPARR